MTRRGKGARKEGKAEWDGEDRREEEQVGRWLRRRGRRVLQGRRRVVGGDSKRGGGRVGGFSERGYFQKIEVCF